MIRQKINLESFVHRGGEYSHGYSIEVANSRFVYTSNQIAVDERGQALYENDPIEQTKYVIETTGRVLAEAGATLKDVVKTTIYITDMSYFPDVSDVWDEYFRECQPASTLVEIKSIGHPSCIVGVEVVAVVEKS